MRMTKRFGALALTASMFLVVACGSDDNTTTTEAPS